MRNFRRMHLDAAYMNHVDQWGDNCYVPVSVEMTFGGRLFRLRMDSNLRNVDKGERRRP